MAYLGPTVTVADVVVRPSRSIIKQSYDARERRNDSSLPFHLGWVRCWATPLLREVLTPCAAEHTPYCCGNAYAVKPACSLSSRFSRRWLPASHHTVCCHCRYGNLNGDGFGIGWFPPASSCKAATDPTPCVRAPWPRWRPRGQHRRAPQRLHRCACCAARPQRPSRAQHRVHPRCTLRACPPCRRAQDVGGGAPPCPRRSSPASPPPGITRT